ncbi:MAG TPA: amidophosphoribosyltransferase [Firmicutes bacterium]|nr:amidophosphoribosyltransferase [Bacillota bacterium]
MASDNMKEECGVIGMFDLGGGDVGRDLCYGLFALQHRGHMSCGVVTNDNYKLTSIKDNGHVNEVLSVRAISTLKGRIGIGHVRASGGDDLRENIQPITTRYCKGTISLAKNGYITNAENLRNALEDDGAIFQSTRDTEVIMHLIARARTTCPSAETSLLEVMDSLEGAYSMILMSPKKLMAARDPRGYRPLCMGRKGRAVVFASETCALDAMGAEYVRDIEPGELVCVDDKFGVRSFKNFCGKRTSLCIYEYVYFSRPDSILDGNEVYAFREKAGRLLARACPAEADIVCGVPDGGTVFAQGYANETGIPLKAGVMKNKFSSRNLFTHDSEGRENAIKLKYNVLRKTVEGKSVALVDDSIMRGETARRIITMLKNAGAGAVHLRIGCPRILHKCIYGVQMPDERDLLASGGRTNEEMCAYLGCESIGFLPTDALKETGLSDKFTYCTSCLDGKLHMKSNG